MSAPALLADELMDTSLNSQLPLSMSPTFASLSLAGSIRIAKQQQRAQRSDRGITFANLPYGPAHPPRRTGDTAVEMPIFGDVDEIDEAMSASADIFREANATDDGAAADILGVANPPPPPAAESPKPLGRAVGSAVGAPASPTVTATTGTPGPTPGKQGAAGHRGFTGFDADEAKPGPVVHVVDCPARLPPSTSRVWLSSYLRATARRYFVAWWCAAHDREVLRLSLLQLLDAMDPTRCASGVAANESLDLAVLETALEHHSHRSRTCVLVMDYVTRDVLHDFLATKSPRWNVHVVAFCRCPGEILADAPIAALAHGVRPLPLPLTVDGATKVAELSLTWRACDACAVKPPGVSHYAWNDRINVLKRVGRACQESPHLTAVAHRQYQRYFAEEEDPYTYWAAWGKHLQRVQAAAGAGFLQPKAISGEASLRLSGRSAKTRDPITVALKAPDVVAAGASRKRTLPPRRKRQGADHILSEAFSVLLQRSVSSESTATMFSGAASPPRGGGDASGTGFGRPTPSFGSITESISFASPAASPLRSLAASPVGSPRGDAAAGAGGPEGTAAALPQTKFSENRAVAVDVAVGLSAVVHNVSNNPITAVACASAAFVGVLEEVAHDGELVAALKLSLALPVAFPAALFPDRVVDALCQMSLWHYMGEELVYVPPETTLGVEAYLRSLDYAHPSQIGSAEGTGLLGGFGASHVEQVFNLALSWLQSANVRQHRDVTWRRWANTVASFVVRDGRRRRLFLPSADAVLTPLAKPPLDLTSLPVLPEDASEWGRHHIDAVTPYVVELLARSRFEDAARMLEAQLCVLLRAVEQTHEARLPVSLAQIAAVFCVERELAQIYTKCSRGGVSERYANRANALVRAMCAERRDTPARGTGVFFVGRMLLELAAQESKRYRVTQRSALLTDEGSDSQLHAMVRAEVEQRAYVSEAAKQFAETVDAYKDTPLGLVGAEVCVAHKTIANALTTDLRDRDALRHARKAFEAGVAMQRGTGSMVSRPPVATGLTLREHVAWARKHAPVMFAALRDGDYDSVHHHLDKTWVLAFLGAIDGHDEAVAFCTSVKPETTKQLTDNVLPTPRLYEHLMVHATLTDRQVARAHGLSWEGAKAAKKITFAAHLLLETCGAADVAALELLARLLELGVDPRACSPHNMKSLLHIAVERHLVLHIGLLLRHELVEVEYTASHCLCARRDGLSTVARVSTVPNPLPHPLHCCQDPLVVELMLTKGHSPLDTLRRNRAGVLEKIAEVPSRLEGLFDDPESDFTREIPAILLDFGVSCPTRCRIADHVRGDDVRGCLLACTEVPVVRRLMVRLYEHLTGNPVFLTAVDAAAAKLTREQAKEVADIACRLVQLGQDELVECMLTEFAVQADLMHWEHIAEYRRRRRVQKEEEEEAREREMKAKEKAAYMHAYADVVLEDKLNQPAAVAERPSRSEKKKPGKGPRA